MQRIPTVEWLCLEETTVLTSIVVVWSTWPALMSARSALESSRSALVWVQPGPGLVQVRPTLVPVAMYRSVGSPDVRPKLWSLPEAVTHADRYQAQQSRHGDQKPCHWCPTWTDVLHTGQIKLLTCFLFILKFLDPQITVSQCFPYGRIEAFEARPLWWFCFCLFFLKN